MIFDSVIAGILFFGSTIILIGSIITNDGGYGAFSFFTALISGILFFLMICAKRDGNREIATYSFPAENYNLEVVITDTFVDGQDSTGNVKRDTIYVLQGIEPRFSDSDDEELKTMRLKTVTREPIKKTE